MLTACTCGLITTVGSVALVCMGTSTTSIGTSEISSLSVQVLFRGLGFRPRVDQCGLLGSSKLELESRVEALSTAMRTLSI